MLEKKISHAVLTGCAVKDSNGGPGPDLLLEKTLGRSTTSNFSNVAYEQNPLPFRTPAAQLKRLQPLRTDYLKARQSQQNPPIVVESVVFLLIIFVSYELTGVHDVSLCLQCFPRPSGYPL